MTRYLEDIVRPFTILESKPVSRIVLDSVTNVATLPPATITWGGPSNFIVPDAPVEDPIVAEWGDLSADPNWSGAVGGSTATVSQIPPGDFLDRYAGDILRPFDDALSGKPIWEEFGLLEEELGEEEVDEQALEKKVVLREIGRSTTTVRVENPSDSSQYVDVERINRIAFRDPNGFIYEFVLNNGGGY